MPDQDYPDLYEALESSAERAANAAVSFEGILGGTETQQIPVNGFPAQPTVAKRVKDRVAAETGPRLAVMEQQVTNSLNQADARIDEHLTQSNEHIDSRLDAVEAGLNIKKYSSYNGPQGLRSDPIDRDGVLGIVMGDPDPNLDGYYLSNKATGSYVRLVQQPLMSEQVLGGKDLFNLLDANRMQTWLGVNSVDGGPSEHAERLLRLMFGIFSQDRTGYIAALVDKDRRMTDLAIRESDGQFDDFVLERWGPRIYPHLPIKFAETGRTGYLIGVCDANKVMTDLCVDDVTGQFPPFVVERLAPRIAQYLPQLTGGDWLPNDRYTNSAGENHDVFTKMRSWSGWGSSTIDEWSELGVLAGQMGATYYNGGNGATELQHHLAQMGARPALLLPTGGSIPASGAVTVTCSNVIPNAAFKPTSGTLAGTPGVLTSSATAWTFTRTGSGVAVAVSSEAPFIPSQGLAHRGDMWVFQVGKNDMNNDRPMQQTMEWHALAFNWNSALSKRIIVMTHFSNTGTAGTAQADKVAQMNAFIRSTYGGLVFDLVEYLCSQDIWADTGITPTAADLENQAGGCLAASLSRDNYAHMNPTARTAVAQKIKQKLITMGWFTE